MPYDYNDEEMVWVPYEYDPEDLEERNLDDEDEVEDDDE